MNKYLLLSSLILLGCSPIEKEQSKTYEQVFQVIFDHRGNKTNKALVDKLIYQPSQQSISNKLNVTQQTTSLPPSQSNNRYYMNVESVFCGEDVCKVDFVKIFWDELGFYQRYELAPKVTLEKGNGEDFTQQDYQKLHKNLLNRQNGLGNLYKSELIKTDGGGNTVDALSGATVALNKQDYVEGAIWTCYTLWHFANGELPKIIRNITARRFQDNALIKLLSQPNKRDQHFAVEQLIRRNNKTQAATQQIIAQYSPKDKKLARLIIQYVETLQNKQYFKAILSLLSNNNTELKLYALTSLTTTNKVANTKFYQALTKQVNTWSSYQNISLYLEHLSTKKINTPIVITPLIALLKHQNFSVARDAYWFLYEHSKQLSYKPNQHTKQLLKQFYQKYQNQL